MSNAELLRAFADRFPTAQIIAPAGALAALVSTQRASEAPTPPPDGVWRDLRALGRLFPNTRGTPRSPSALRADVVAGLFGTVGDDDGPRIERNRWAIPHVAVLRRLRGSTLPVEAEEPTRSDSAVRDISTARAPSP